MESPWFWEETLKRGLGPERHDMEVPIRGAACRCASVSEGFLHRNCVLSVPSQLHVTVVFSKPPLLPQEVLSSQFLKILLFGQSCHCSLLHCPLQIVFSCCNNLENLKLDKVAARSGLSLPQLDLLR